MMTTNIDWNDFNHFLQSESNIRVKKEKCYCQVPVYKHNLIEERRDKKNNWKCVNCGVEFFGT